MDNIVKRRFSEKESNVFWPGKLLSIPFTRKENRDQGWSWEVVLTRSVQMKR